MIQGATPEENAYEGMANGMQTNKQTKLDAWLVMNC